MALFGKDIAIASVGISCQTAFQLYDLDHVSLLTELVGEPLEKHGTPFDWLLCSAGDVAKMIRDGQTFPEDIAELQGNRRPYWPRYRCWFWHRMFELPEQFFGQARYEWQRWTEIKSRREKHFFVCNTQNNLARHPVAKDLDRSLGNYEALSLRTALVEMFGHGVTLHVVSYDPEPKNCPVTWHQIKRDGSQWCGSNPEWEKVFRKVFAKVEA